jgi:selenocysteine lyase/cysteine desulfurase
VVLLAYSGLIVDMSTLFPGASCSTYLNTASMALGNQPASDALATAVSDWQAGRFDFVAAEAAAEELRAKVASLIGASSSDMAIVTGASGAASTVAAQLPDGIPGSNVVVPKHDFLSNFIAWSMLADRGYELRLVDDVDGVLSPDSFAGVADSKTAVIATSMVQSATGFRVDVDALKTIANENGAWLVMDASQAMGGVDFDIDGIDAMFSCSHKWLLGIRGMAHLYVSAALSDSFVPITPGWKATSEPIRSFYGPDFELADRGSRLDASFGWFDALANLEGLRIIDGLGISKIEAHNLSLVDELEDAGVEVAFELPNRSPIVSIGLINAESAMQKLGDRKISASLRAGSLRASLHLYNTSEDVQSLAAAIL